MWRKDDINHTGESWYSHKTEAGTWCNGKDKKGGNSDVLARLERIEKAVNWLVRNNPNYKAPEQKPKGELPY